MSYFKNPQGFKTHTLGKSIDMDNFPKSQKYQCWDLFAYFCTKENLDVNTYCNLTGYAGDLYKQRFAKGFDKYFEFFYPKHAQRGDWIFWDGHVAMVWDVDLTHDRVNTLGQNQGVPRVNLKEYRLSTALGCMRYIPWMNNGMNGWIRNEGNWYYFDHGEYLTGWHQLTWSKGQDWFYFESNGHMVTGWKTIKYKGKQCRFYFDENGAMVTSGHEVGGNWYFFDKDGVMQTGDINVTAVFDESGKMVKVS